MTANMTKRMADRLRVVAAGLLVMAGMIAPNLSAQPVQASLGNWCCGSTAGSGVAPWETFRSVRLDAWLTLRVNVANGNLNIATTGQTMPGVNGFDESVSPQYNSFSSTVNGATGPGWIMGTGRDVGLDLSTMTFYDSSGHAYRFGGGSCAFTPPPGLDAQLTCNSGYLLTYNASGTKLQFDDRGYLSWEQDRQGNTVYFSYDSGGNLTTITDTEGQSSTIGYSPTSGKLSGVTDSAGRTWSYTIGNVLTQIKDPAGNTTSFGYVSTTDHHINQITDPRGNVTSITYDASGRVSSIAVAGTHSWFFTYGSGSTAVEDPNAHTTTYAYDSSNRVTSITDPLMHQTVQGWTGDDHLASVKLPSGAQTSYTYDSKNNLTQISYPTGARVNWAYTDTSLPYLPSLFTDAEGNATSYGYNGAGQVNLVTDAAGHQTSYSYNANGTLASVVDPDGHTTSYTYNSSGLISGITPPSPLGAESVTYDSYNLVATKTDGKGQLTSYGYDRVDEPTSVSYAGGASVSYQHDGDGNQTSLVDGTGTTTYTFDGINQETQVSFPNGQSVTQGWDGLGNLLTKTDSGGKVTYAYAADNHVSSMTDPQGQQTTFGYDVDGNRTSIAFANGVTESMQYNGARQLTQISASKGSTALTSFNYSYTNPGTGQATGLRYSVTMSSGTTKYGYDSLNRLIQASGPSSSFGYGYDNAGNLTNDNGTTLQYNAANELTQAGGETYTFDANGNETGSSAGLSIQVNSQDQTTSMTPPGGSAVPMAYSGEGQAMRTSAGTATFQYDATGLSSMTQSGSTTYFTRLPDGTVLAERTPGGTYDYLVDGLGSIVALTNSSGSVVNTYGYDPYGNAISVTGSVSNPFRFDGAYLDSTGFYKMGERFYDPSVGRWTQMDRFSGFVLSPRSLDRFSFVADAPVDLIDLGGLCTAADYALIGIDLGSSLLGAALAETGVGLALALIGGAAGSTELGKCLAGS